MQVWMDLSPIEFEFLRTRYIALLQEVGMGVLESSIAETVVMSKNFDSSVIALEGIRENSGIMFGTDFSSIEIGVTQFLQTLTRTSPRLVLLEVSKVDTLFAINSESQFVQLHTPGDRTNDKTKILSKIVSVFAKNVKNRFMPEGLNLTLRHLALQKGIAKECVHWDIHTNSWTKSGGSTVASNETHTSCFFNYLSTYAVIEKEETEEGFEVMIVLALSLSTIFLVTTSAICCILCWKRIKDQQYINHAKDNFDPVVDNQPLCQIHQTLNKPIYHGVPSQYMDDSGHLRHNTSIPTSKHNAQNKYLNSMETSQGDGDFLNDLTVPQRPVLGQFGNWHSNNSSPSHNLLETVSLNPHLVNSYSQGNIYAEVDPNYQADSGFTEDSSDLPSDRKEDSAYNSSSSNSNFGHYDGYRIRNGCVRPDIIGTLNPSIQEEYRRCETNKQKPGKPKVFSISKTMIHGNIPYSSDESEDKQVGNFSLRTVHDRNLRKTKKKPQSIDNKYLLPHQENRSKQSYESHRVS